MILNAIREASTLKMIQVVLGPDKNHPDIVRLDKLLGFMGRQADIVPLYAEDVLGFPGWVA